MISCARMCVKKELKSTSCCASGVSTSFEIGVRVALNLASCTFFNMTRLEPRALMMRSSFGKL
ncbi:hypothetical protein D3C72_2090150 [compost metagenome]